MCIECVHEVHFTDEYLRNAFLPIACEALTPSTVTSGATVVGHVGAASRRVDAGCAPARAARAPGAACRGRGARPRPCERGARRVVCARADVLRVLSLSRAPASTGL